MKGGIQEWERYQFRLGMPCTGGEAVASTHSTGWGYWVKLTSGSAGLLASWGRTGASTGPDEARLAVLTPAGEQPLTTLEEHVHQGVLDLVLYVDPKYRESAEYLCHDMAVPDGTLAADVARLGAADMACHRTVLEVRAPLYLEQEGPSSAWGPAASSAFLHYVYTDSLPPQLDLDTLLQVLFMGRVYKLGRLHGLAEVGLAGLLSPQTVDAVYLGAVHCTAPRLQDAVARYLGSPAVRRLTVQTLLAQPHRASSKASLKFVKAMGLTQDLLAALSDLPPYSLNRTQNIPELLKLV